MTWTLAACAVLLVFCFTASFVDCTKVDGNWSAWSQWSGCAAGICSGNQRIRTRTCTRPIPSGGGKSCEGDNAEQEFCQVDGGWSEWSQWSTCTKPCGGALVNRTRRCDNPKPSPDGKPCEAGPSVQTKTDCVSPCPTGPMDGNWSPWSEWTSCPKTCGVGGATIKRSRKCDNPPPMNGGNPCVGKPVQQVEACFTPCPVDGGFGAWSAWTQCSKTCGTGTITRKRACTQPKPQYGGKNCAGDFNQFLSCQLEACPNAINGSWSEWSAWTPCTEAKFCLKGVTHRSRTCDNPSPLNGGNDCQGMGEESRSCPTVAQGCEVHRPARPDAVPADPTSFVAQECSADHMYYANGSHSDKVPRAVYQLFNFTEKELRNSWFALQTNDNLTTFCFQFNDPVDVRTMVTNKADYYDRVRPLPNWNKPDLDTNVPNVAITLRNNVTLTKYEFEIGKTEEYIPEYFFSLHDVRFSYSTEGFQAAFKAKGEYRRIPGVVYQSEVFFDGPSGNTYAKGTADKVTFKQVIQSFGLPVDSLPKSIYKALDGIGLWEFTMTQSSFMYKLHKVYLMQIASSAHLKGVPVHVEIIVGTRMARPVFAVGIVFDRFSFGQLIRKLSGLEDPFLDGVGNGIKIGLSYAPSQLLETHLDMNVHYSRDPLKSLIIAAIPKDIFIAAMVGLPKNCGVSKFCEITKRLLGPDFLFALTASITKKYVRVSATIQNIPFPFLYNKGVMFSRLDLYIEADWNGTNRHIKMGFRCDIAIPVKGDIIKDGIKLPTEKVFLMGKLEFDFLQATLRGNLAMKGLLRRAFGFPNFAMGNINLGINWMAGSPVPSGGLIGMRIEIGEDCLNPWDFDANGHCFAGSGYVGAGDTQFFYADVTTLTMGKVARMLNLKAKLPPPLEESGFPNGLKVAYGSTTTDLRLYGGPVIGKGVTVKGLAEVLGYQMSTDVYISSSKMSFSLKTDPIRLGEYINIVRSPKDHINGPYFYCHLREDPIYVETHMEGYARVFGVEAYFRLNLTMGAFEVRFKGQMWNLIHADVFMYAQYVPFLHDLQFYVKVDVDLNGFTEALDKAGQSVRSAFLQAKEKLRNAQERVASEKGNCQRKMQLKCDKCKSLKCNEAENGCKGFLDAAGKWIGDRVNDVGNFFKKVFKGWRRKRALLRHFVPEPANGQFIPLKKSRFQFFRGQRKRRDLERVINQEFLLHVRRRRFVTKVICEGLVSGGCKAVSSLCEGSCSLVNHIAPGLCNLLDVAVAFLKGVERACGWVGAVTEYAATKFFVVHSIKYEFGLDDAVWGAVPTSYTFTSAMDLTLFGKRIFQPFKLTLINPLGSILSGADAAVSWFERHANPKYRTTTEKSHYDKPSSYSDFDFTERFSIENQQSATEDRLGACLYVETKVLNTPVKVTGCKEDDLRQQFIYTLDGQIMNVHSQMCLDTNGGGRGSRLIQSTCNKRRDDQNFQCDLALRTMKRRRVDLCLTAGKTGLNGPGSIAQLSSLKCIHVQTGGITVPADGTRLVIWGVCSEKRLEFELRNGTLIHTRSGKCARPIGHVTNGVRVGLFKSCAGHVFSFTPGGSIQHVASRMCVGTKSGLLNPINGDDIVLKNKCENNDFSANKDSLLFSFIPTNPYVHLDACGDVDNVRLDQRFEVAANPVASICSKFAKNIALKKPTQQSSTSYSGFSERAVDGVYNEDYSFRSCTHTDEEDSPWWRVDLGAEHIVTDVLILNRRKYSERLRNFEVRVGANEQSLLNPTCSERVFGVGKGSMLRLQCDPPVPGRYVSVYMFGRGILSLCEVSVYSRIGAMADLCQLENGGCQQVCTNTCNLKVKCQCRPGYLLAYDSRTCLDVNECLVNNGGCDVYNGKCVNTPGGHLCTCNPGFQLKENSKTICEGVKGRSLFQMRTMAVLTKCSVNNAGCEHICVDDSEGKHHCDCRTGYKLAQDGFACQDVNECEKENGGCEHDCHNFDGGHYCTCRVGHTLLEDGQGCEELSCPPLEPPVNTHVTPSLCTSLKESIRHGTVCFFACPTGHFLAGGENSRKCLINGTWSGTSPQCKPVVCPKLNKPDNGNVTPASCLLDDVEYGTECVFTCDDGFELRGPRYTTCHNESTWTDLAPVSCAKVSKDPWLLCPSDVVMELAADQSSVVLEHHWELPETNMKNLSVTPSYLRDTFPFPAGKTRVTWTAVSDSGDGESCFYYVVVKDVTPPTVHSCPGPVKIITDNEYEPVHWDEPLFTDNVGVVSLIASKKPGHKMQRGSSLNVRYTASDAAGNSAWCDFLVTVESRSCPTIVNPNHGDATYSKLQLHIQCHPGYYLNPRPTGAKNLTSVTYHCVEGKWRTSGFDAIDSLMTSIADCVEHYTPDKDRRCPIGTVLQETGDCLSCAPGTYHNEQLDKCDSCYFGTYQDEEGQAECQPCSRGFSTKDFGSKSKNDCLPLCRPGYYSDNGLQESFSPCEACPRGTYQASAGYTTCLLCPDGSSTNFEGSTSVENCTVPASITQTISADNVTMGSSPTLKCFVEGQPSPNITWTKVGGQLDLSRSRSTAFRDFEFNVIGSQLVISNVTSSDSGEYECHAENRAGRDVKRLRLRARLREVPHTEPK